MLIASESLTGNVLFAVQVLSIIANRSIANTQILLSSNSCHQQDHLAISSWLDHWLRCCLRFCSSLAFVITCLLICLGSSIPCSDTPRSANGHDALYYGANSGIDSNMGGDISSRSWLPMQCQSCWKLHWYKVMFKAQHWTLSWLVLQQA